MKRGRHRNHAGGYWPAAATEWIFGWRW